MTLKQLEVFVAIAESLSFSKGAEKTGITQSTASQHIQGLEEELEIKLFDRGRGGALLTEGGKLFFQRARKILYDCGESRSAVRRFLGMEGVLLRVGASCIPAAWLIPAMLGKFIEQCPKVRLEVLQGESLSVIKQLVDEETELGLTGWRTDDPRIIFEPVGEDEIVCAVSAEIPSGVRYSLSQAQLRKVPLVVSGDSSGTQMAVYEALAGTWISRESLNIVAVMGSAEAVRRSLLNGIGYAFVSSMSIAEELANGRLTTVRIPGLNIYRRFYAARREGRELSPAATAFLELVLSHKINCSRKRGAF